MTDGGSNSVGTVQLPLSPSDFVQVADHVLPPKLAHYALELGGASMMKRLDPLILSAVIWHESQGNPKAVSFDGGHGKGLGQIDDRTFPTFCAAHWGLMGPPLVFEPDFNALAAARLLRENLDALMGDVWPAVAAYNAGLAAVRRALGKISTVASPAERFAAANTATYGGVYLDRVRAHFQDFTAAALKVARGGDNVDDGVS